MHETSLTSIPRESDATSSKRRSFVSSAASPERIPPFRRTKLRQPSETDANMGGMHSLTASTQEKWSRFRTRKHTPNIQHGTRTMDEELLSPILYFYKKQGSPSGGRHSHPGVTQVKRTNRRPSGVNCVLNVTVLPRCPYLPKSIFDENQFSTKIDREQKR